MYIEPFFSILIPTYQSQKYIVQAIQSVLCQDFENYEIIIVDDGSDDHTKEQLEEFINEKIYYYYIKHSGTQNARKWAVSKAKGEYLIFLDADDELTPGALKNIYYNIRTNPCDLYIGGMTFFDKDGKDYECNYEFSEGYINKKNLFRKMTKDREIKTLARKVLRREKASYNMEIIKEHVMTYGEDMFYSMDVLLNVETIFFSHDLMYCYKLHKDGIMNRFCKNKYKDRVLMCEAIWCYGEELGIDVEEIAYIADIYITKQLADCLIELSNADIPESEKNEIIGNIVEILSGYSEVILSNEEQYMKRQLEIMRMYGVC